MTVLLDRLTGGLVPAVPVPFRGRHSEAVGVRDRVLALDARGREDERLVGQLGNDRLPDRIDCRPRSLFADPASLRVIDLAEVDP